MNTMSKLFMLLASLSLGIVFFLPIWNIDLEAPQYPEGIGLKIWTSQITGKSEFDLDNINKLNHYIGMKAIEPDSIMELKIMPFIIIAFSIFGLLIIFFKKRFLINIWLFSLLILLAIGMYDFYMWEYDYGHNLNPHAPIKVPGMVYQPPLLGTKQLLNMRTTSSPAIGTYLIGFSILFAVVALKKSRKKNENN